MEAGIIADPEAITWQLKAADVLAAGDKACTTPVSDMASAFPKVGAQPMQQDAVWCFQ